MSTEIYDWLTNDVFPDNGCGLFVYVGSRIECPTIKNLIRDGWLGLRLDNSLEKLPLILKDYEVGGIVELLYIDNIEKHTELFSIPFQYMLFKTIVVPKKFELPALVMYDGWFRCDHRLVKQNNTYNFYLHKTLTKESQHAN